MNQAVTDVKLPGIPLLKQGKVRQVFDLGSEILIVATDRISAFDLVLNQGIPQKGMILNRLSCFWFDYTKGIIRNHLITADVDSFPAELKPYAELLRGRSMIARKATTIPIECVVRGFLAGSAWEEYREKGTICGQRYENLKQSQQLPDPIFTPATKSTSGHDQNITIAEAGRIVGRELAARLEQKSIEVYKAVFEYASNKGIIIADTKFEFGLDGNDAILIDEMFTPDSSRFWAKEDYEVGKSPPSFDKQFVRDYLISLNWNRQPPAPDLPPDIIRKTQEKYLEAEKRLLA